MMWIFGFSSSGFFVCPLQLVNKKSRFRKKNNCDIFICVFSVLIMLTYKIAANVSGLGGRGTKPKLLTKIQISIEAQNANFALQTA